jgi:hypothetical protein
MADENSTAYLRELRLIRIALYLIALLLAMIFCSLAFNFWAESTRPPRTAAHDVRSGRWVQRTRDLGPVAGPWPVASEAAQGASGATQAEPGAAADGRRRVGFWECIAHWGGRG